MATKRSVAQPPKYSTAEGEQSAEDETSGQVGRSGCNRGIMFEREEQGRNQEHLSNSDEPNNELS